MYLGSAKINNFTESKENREIMLIENDRNKILAETLLHAITRRIDQ